MLTKRRRGSKGGPSPGVPPLRAAPPPAAPAPPWGWRWMKARVVEDADPYGGWETGRVPLDLLRYYPTPGRGSAERGGAGKNRDSGTSRTPSPTGRVRVRRGCVNGYAQASVTQKPVGVGVPDDPLFRRPRGKNKQYNEKNHVCLGGVPPPPKRTTTANVPASRIFSHHVFKSKMPPHGRHFHHFAPRRCELQ